MPDLDLEKLFGLDELLPKPSPARRALGVDLCRILNDLPARHPDADTIDLFELLCQAIGTWIAINPSDTHADLRRLVQSNMQSAFSAAKRAQSAKRADGSASPST